MISFRHKSSIRQVKIKTKKDLTQRMPPWLQQIFGIKNPIVGFKVSGNKYYDPDCFYTRIQKFYGQTVDIIQANDQLQISFISQNLNSSSFIKPNQPLQEAGREFLEQYPQSNEEQIKIVKDLKSLEQKLKENNTLSIFFDVHEIYKREIAQSASYIRNNNSGIMLNLFMKNHTAKTVTQPTYSIYIGRKLVATLNLTRQYKQTIQMVTERYSKKLQDEKNNWMDNKILKGQQKQYTYKGSYQQENQAPSFTTYQLQERLNQDACQDYLLRMYQEKILKKYEYLKLSEKCDENFIEFYRIFCEGAIDNDYENFRNQILMKVENNLEILLSNVDEMDLSRPISREEQRRQNLKKSVPNIEIVKVQNYFEILDQLKSYLSARSISQIKAELLDENQNVFSLFSDYLSRKISKQQLAESLQNAVSQIHNKNSPASPVKKRSGSRLLGNPTTLNQSDDITGISPIIEQEQEQPARQINFLGMGKKEKKEEKVDKNQPKQTPPMFGSSKNQGNFSPIKYMSDIQSNYKQAWARLQNKAHLFQPEEYGLLYYYLQARDDSISNIVQELQWDEHSSIEKLKEHLGQRIKQIMKQNFKDNEISAIELNKKESEFDCIYQNFKYESDLNAFLASLKYEVAQIFGSPTDKQIRRKKSDGQLLGKSKEKERGKRRYSDEQQSIQGGSSPKSSFSRPKTVENALSNLQIANTFWINQFERMIENCDFRGSHKEEYVRTAFKQGNPAVYSWVHKFIRNKEYINKQQIINDTRLGDYDYKLIGKIAPIFHEILNFYVSEGRITQKIKHWHIAQIVNLNVTVLAIFEEYIEMGNEEQFIENLILTFECFDKQMYFYKLYLSRIEAVLKEMSAHDEISLSIFKKYPEKIKAFCELFYVSGDVQDLLENLHIMYSVEVKQRKLKVATLNFSGVNTSPFEYHDNTEQLTQMSNIMKQLMLTPQIKEYFASKKPNKIDKKFTNNSVSIRFGNNILDSSNKLYNKQQYIAAWFSQFQSKAIEELRDESQENKQVVAMFDYYCYISLVRYLLKAEWDEKFEIPNIKSLNPNPVIDYIQKKQKQPACRLDLKEKAVWEYLDEQNVDVLFLQEAGTVNWNAKLPQRYSLASNSDSVIIYDHNKIGKKKNHKDLLQFTDKLNFNKDTAHFFSDQGYLLISSHLTSKAHKIEQGQQVFNVLNEIKNQYPLMKIIMGIDANHFMSIHQNIGSFEVYPQTDSEHTSTKMRTYLQMQTNKADQLASDVKDHIITTQSLQNYSICTIKGIQPEGRIYLPCKQHPYDHLIVQGNIAK